jgi:putative DNA primase/helicase
MIDLADNLEAYADKLIPKTNDANPDEYRLTELGNAERFAEQHKEYLRYVAPWKKWIYYNGKRWIIGADEIVRKLGHQTAKSFYAAAADETDREKAAKLAKWGAVSCRSSSISAMLKEAAALLTIDPALLDANPWFFNCENCTIDIRSLTTHDHRREDYITKIAPVVFDPKAAAPIFERTLKRCLPQNLIDYIQRFFGYCLTGSTREQKIDIWWGDGANGKSTSKNAITAVLGDYAQTTRPETLMVKRNDSIPSDLAKLKGARLVTAEEAEDGHRLAESAIKQMTGGDRIQARFLYADYFEFMPEFKILLCTNHKPIITGIDHAIWRRIQLVPFTVTIPEAEQDKDLPEKLNCELSGILNWMLIGAGGWLANGLECPEEVIEATANYQSEQSVINVFLEGRCIVRDDAMVEAGMLFREFDQWRINEGHRKLKQTKFGRMLAQLGFEKGRLPGSGRMVYRGIGLNER